jgi:SiaC family regulatory phosphoprotein
MVNGVYKEEATEDTPLFLIDTNTNSVLIQGISMPENSFEFYDPLEKKSLEAFSNHKGDLSLEIELTYLNSMSSKQLLKLIKLLSSRHPTIKVTWKFVSDDDLMRMKGEEIKEICEKVDISLVEMN